MTAKTQERAHTHTHTHTHRYKMRVRTACVLRVCALSIFLSTNWILPRADKRHVTQRTHFHTPVSAEMREGS